MSTANAFGSDTTHKVNAFRQTLPLVKWRCTSPLTAMKLLVNKKTLVLLEGITSMK